MIDVRNNQTQTVRAVLLNLPNSLCDELDRAGVVLRMPRTRLILRSIVRDLNSVLGEEVKEAARYQERMEEKYGLWINQ